VSSAFDLTGRTALVTGAGSRTGIGFATARLLSAMGAAVIVTSTTDRINDRVGELRANGAEAIGIVGDLSDPVTAPNLIESAIERWGKLDVATQKRKRTNSWGRRHDHFVLNHESLFFRESRSSLFSGF